MEQRVDNKVQQNDVRKSFEYKQRFGSGW